MTRDSGVSSELSDRLEHHRGNRSGPTGTLTVSDSDGYVGDDITILARNLSPDTELELLWHTQQGKWGVLKANEIVGPQFGSHVEVIETVTADESGAFDYPFTIPEDYGGDHVIELRSIDGTTIDKTTVSVSPWFELERTSAPLGETFMLRGYGLGPNPVSNNFQVTWDNGMVGYLTGTVNAGTATAPIRAVGPPGKHVIRVWRNYRGVPFLQNNTQSPYGSVAGDRPAKWAVTVAEPDVDSPVHWVDEMPEESPLSVHYPTLDETTDAELSISPQSGTAGTQAVIQGRNFPPRESVNLVWHRHEDDFVEDVGIQIKPKPDVLPIVETDGDGSFTTTVTIPRDKGATRPITARVAGQSVAITGFVIQPDIVSVTPTSGPVGTEIEIEIEGIGWPAYSTMYFTYDNKMVGYVCGNSDLEEHGITRTRFEAVGDPGMHVIEAYPTIFETREDEPNFEIKPHLSYLDNHPVRPLPALHAMFEVTDKEY